MAIALNDTSRNGYPVLKRQAIGEISRLAIIRYEQRDVLRRNAQNIVEPVLKPNGKPRQELIIHGIVMPGTTAQAGLADQIRIPDPGERVRMILRGGGYGAWIQARRQHRQGMIHVGDVIRQEITYAQAYDAAGSPRGEKITSQVEAARLPRSTSVGFYGPISLTPAEEMPWIEAAEQAYRQDQAIQLEATAAEGWSADAEEELPF